MTPSCDTVRNARNSPKHLLRNNSFDLVHTAINDAFLAPSLDAVKLHSIIRKPLVDEVYDSSLDFRPII
jgi:hypothetical protein